MAFHALGRTWRNRSTVEELDEAGRPAIRISLCHRRWQPLHARWTWTVTDEPAGSRLTVIWTLHPVTFWRRVLLVRLRSRQLARSEVPALLSALASLLAAGEAERLYPGAVVATPTE